MGKLILLIILVQVIYRSINGCTHFRLIPNDNSVIIGRSMEYDFFLNERFVSEPQGSIHHALTPPIICSDSASIIWKSKYNVINADTVLFGQHGGAGGMNSEGLSAETLYLSKYTVFDKIKKTDCNNTIGSSQVSNYILANFKTVEEVVNSLNENVFPKVWGMAVKEEVIPVHWVISDANGKGIVLEYTKNGRMIHENWLGIATNSPTYDWHMANLQNYAHLQSTDVEQFEMGGRTLKTGGEGFGFLGIPGDFTPPSRFIRTAFIKEFADKVETADDGVNLAFHILNTVDIPKGPVKDARGKIPNYTQNIYVQDLTNKRIFYRAYNDMAIRVIDMKKVSFDQPREILLEGNFMNNVVDTTDQLQPITDECNESIGGCWKMDTP